ncbi:MAG TPA: hypothetical protein VIM73_12400 [Polyangiaceae bacterium]
MPSRKNKVSLIVVELGSEWPSWLNSKLGGGSRRVLSQDEGESPQEFAVRVLGVVEGDRLRLRGATLLCNERADAEQASARTTLAQALRTHLEPDKSGELLFAAPERARRTLPPAIACA